MKAILCVAVQLMLCIGGMAFVNLAGCQRKDVEVFKAKDSAWLRQEIKNGLQFEMDDADVIARFMVYDGYLGKAAYVFFAGSQKNEKAVTFIYGWREDGKKAPLQRIPYSLYYRYLECEVEADKQEEPWR
ncbi:unnamed protein product [Heligmosomoides polygyrus]|uniref:Cystatin domain-containing protein n=1 Tax=Heligmosomoides polygyrus TaxID=6339 RepID=A0A183G0P7_HELPZ|nr:unnamed protein product [Heligmosomoides polygyrus]